MDWRDSADRIEPALANEPTEKMQANEATEPIDRTDPAEPMLKIEPEEPMDRIDPLDPMLRIEPAEPADRFELPVIPIPRFSHPGVETTAWAVGARFFCPAVSAGSISGIPFVVRVDEPKKRLGENVHRMEER